MKKVLGATALLGFFLSDGILLSERRADACVVPIYSDGGACNCIARTDHGNVSCTTNGSDPCIVSGVCGGGGPILPL